MQLCGAVTHLSPQPQHGAARTVPQHRALVLSCWHRRAVSSAAAKRAPACSSASTGVGSPASQPFNAGGGRQERGQTMHAGRQRLGSAPHHHPIPVLPPLVIPLCLQPCSCRAAPLAAVRAGVHVLLCNQTPCCCHLPTGTAPTAARCTVPRAGGADPLPLQPLFSPCTFPSLLLSSPLAG